MTATVIVAVVLSLLFVFLNGQNDAARSVATVVSARVLSPRLGVAWAALFNLIGATALGVGVATTVGRDLVDPSSVTPLVVIAALIAAGGWVWVCRGVGLPVSGPHALVGGLVGAALTRAGLGALQAPGLAWFGLFVAVAPIVGGIASLLLVSILLRLVRDQAKAVVERRFRGLQLASSAACALSHGSNDAQKSMGVLAALLYSSGQLGKDFTIPTWVILACAASTAFGTLAGGWGVLRNMGLRLTRIRPLGGFAAEVGTAITVGGCSLAGIPVSTTHTLVGSVAGVGAVQSLGAVRWGVARQAVWAWILTIPMSAMLGAVVAEALRRAGLQG